MKSIIYLIKDKNKALENFYNNIKTIDSDVSYSITYEYSDLAIVYGPPLTDIELKILNANEETIYKNKIKKEIIKNQKKFGGQTVILDISLLGQYEYIGTNRTNHFRVGFDSWMGNADYFTNTVPYKFNDFIYKNDIVIKPYKSRGEDIVICLQKSGDPSLLGKTNIEILDYILHELRQYQKHIIIRPHPYDGLKQDIEDYCYIRNIKYHNSKSISLAGSLKTAWATVMFTSTSCITSLIEGIPCFTLHPYNIGYSMGNINLKNIENPVYKNRFPWFYSVANSDWDLTTEYKELWYRLKKRAYKRSKLFYE